MRAERERKKKLIVAFHFLRAQRTNQNLAGWRCEQCRRQGLEGRRRCGYLPEDKRGPKRVIWAHGHLGVDECPTSFVTPVSAEFLEKFFVWKAVGSDELTAREAEAFMTLEIELRAEQMNGGR